MKEYHSRMEKSKPSKTKCETLHCKSDKKVAICRDSPGFLYFMQIRTYMSWFDISTTWPRRCWRFSEGAPPKLLLCGTGHFCLASQVETKASVPAKLRHKVRVQSFVKRKGRKELQNSSLRCLCCCSAPAELDLLWLHMCKP